MGRGKRKKPRFKWAGHETERDHSFAVAEPTCYNEFEVQAYLWTQLRNLGINARGEVKSRFAGRAMVRFDLAIFENRRLVCVIETKAAPIRHKVSWEATQQGSRYLQFDVPIVLVYGMPQAEAIIEDIKNGASWEDISINCFEYE